MGVDNRTMSDRRRRARSLVLLAVLAAAAVGLIGATGASNSSALSALASEGDSKAANAPARESHALAASPAPVVAAAPRRLQAAGSARIDMTMQMDAPAAASSNMTIHVSGAMNLVAQSADFTMSFDGGGLVGNVLPDPIETRVVDGVMYMNMASLLRAAGGSAAAGLPSGVSWVSFDLSAMSGLGEMGGGSGFGSATDVTGLANSLDMLRSVSSGVRTVGREQVRGTDTMHYQADIDLARALEKAPATVRSMLAGLDTGALGSLPVDVWVDDDGLPRRFTMRMDLSSFAPADSQSELAGASMTMSVDLYDYGVDVHVEAPPASDTFDMKTIMGGPSAGSAS